MIHRKLLSGNEAAVYSAILSGCEHFYGYPITPVNKLLETAADLFNEYNLNFLQTESEIIAINMVMGASAAGARACTATSGPGLSLMQEGLSYMKACDLPAVIINVMRGGPGLGNIYPSQADYNLMTKASGHGDGYTIVLAPNSPQEMFDLVKKAFSLADEYRHPVIVGIDGGIAQSIEEVCFDENFIQEENPEKPWAIRGNGSKNNLTSVRDPPELESILIKHQERYRRIQENEQLFQTYNVDQAEYVIVAYGIVSRIVLDYLEQSHSPNIGMIRPLTLWPFPRDIFPEFVSRESVKAFVSIEANLGQMYHDLKEVAGHKKPVYQINSCGGNLPTFELIKTNLEKIREATNGK